MKDLKFSLLCRQMSDSVVDSKILTGVHETRGSAPDSFSANHILSPDNALLKNRKIAANAEERLCELSQGPNSAPDARSILVKQGEKEGRPNTRRVTFILKEEAPQAVPIIKGKPKPVPVMDYEKALIAEIRAEASAAKRAHQGAKRKHR
jgi:hypothetical protein